MLYTVIGVQGTISTRDYLCLGLLPAPSGVYHWADPRPVGTKSHTMQSQDPETSLTGYSIRREADGIQVSLSQPVRPAASGNINIPSSGGGAGILSPSSASQNPAAISDHMFDLETRSGDDDEEEIDTEAWTQIPGPSDEDMSDSDDSSADVSFQSQIPAAIQTVEMGTTHQSSTLHPVPEVYDRYKAFCLLLCKETATEDATQHVLEGLPVAINTAGSIQLDEATSEDVELDVYALALVIHVWQIVCLRMQHGRLPSEEMEESLCLRWAAYFLSAHSIVQTACIVSVAELRYAVRHWEDRLRSMGRGNRWMEDRWARTIPYVDQDIAGHRNKTADRYLEMLEKYGKEGLAIAIIEEEKKGDWTQLREMGEQSPDGMKNLRRQMASMLYSMNTSLLKAMILGQLPRLAEIEYGTVSFALKELNKREHIQPGIYMNCICDSAGFSPSPEQWQRVCAQMLNYARLGDDHNDLAERIDQQIHPKPEWPRELAHKGIRRYTEWRSYTEKGTYTPDTVHRQWVRYFVYQLQERMKGQPVHAPLSVPVVEFGFSNNPRKRLRQHRHHESSNYLMNLAQAVFEMEFPDTFRLQQRIVFACYRPIQTWMSEIIVTQLAQGYVEGGAGFSHEPAVRSNTSSNNIVPAKIWTMFEVQVYANGKFEKEVFENRQRLQAMEQADQLEEIRKKEDRDLKSALAAHLRNMIALEEARKDLYDALRKRLS